MEACIAVVWRGEKSLLSDPGSELRLGREKDKWQDNRREEHNKKQKSKNVKVSLDIHYFTTNCKNHFTLTTVL